MSKEKEYNGMTTRELITYVTDCRDEADTARVDRITRNKNNYDMFHLRHDFSHKEEGQSQEILSKQSMAVEQTKSFFQQALASLGDWWKADVCYPEIEPTLPIRPAEITKLTNHFLEEARYYSHVGNSVESALLGSVVISKTTGAERPKPRFVAKKTKGKAKLEKIEEKTLKLGLKIVRQENYYPDPTGNCLYEIEDSWPDFFEVKRMAEADEDFDLSVLESLSKGGVDETEENFNAARETGQNSTHASHRPKVKLTEFWGSVVSSSGELLFENVQMIVANDNFLLLPPRPNPLWHQRSPYTASPLLEVSNSVWHKALMDAPTQHNRALIEMYNLVVDAAMSQVHALKQVRKDWLDNPAQVANGLKPGMAVGVNSMCPPGGKVIEPLTDVTIPPEAFNVFGLMQQEFNSSALTTDLRSGGMAAGQMKATAIVEQSQTITSVFRGMATNYESNQVVRELELAWMTVAQHWDDIDREVFISLFGSQRGDELSRLSPEEVFAGTVNGIKFKVYGVTQTLEKAQDFRKLTTLLQTVASSPALMEEYIKKYDLGRTLGEIMTALDINKQKLEIPQAVQMTMQAPEGAPEAQPDQMSQVPQAGAMSDFMAGAPGIPQTAFPGSPAAIGGNQIL